MKLTNKQTTESASRLKGSFEIFRNILPTSWIEMAIESSGAKTKRFRKLPLVLVAWIVIAMDLERDMRIEEVAMQLRLIFKKAGRTPVRQCLVK